MATDSVIMGVPPVSRVAVCIATFRRPVGIDRLLASVDRLRRPPLVDVIVIVCDNDPDRSAHARLTTDPPALDFGLHVIHQPERGVASVRNALVAAAVDLGCDGIAFVDDDEEVPDCWLENLVSIQADAGVGIVSGPVTSVFEIEAPGWLQDLGYFDPIDRAEGSSPSFANSNNVLLHTDVLGGNTAPFDTRLNLTGGEDTHFFRRCVLAGHQIRWTNRCMPLEYVPASKMTAQWMRQREYRRGTTRSFVLLDVEDSLSRRTKRVVAAAAEGARGLVDLVGALRRRGDQRRARVARARNQWAYGAGMIAGLFGAEYSEYETTHGS